MTLGGGLNENVSYKRIWEKTWSLVSGKGLRTVALLEEALRFQKPTALPVSSLCIALEDQDISLSTAACLHTAILLS